MKSMTTRMLAGIFTFALVCIGWVFFRAQTFRDASTILNDMAGMNGLGSNLMLSGHWILLAAAVAGMILQERWTLFELIIDAPDWVRGLVLAGVLYVLILFSFTETAIPFVYFQF